MPSQNVSDVPSVQVPQVQVACHLIGEVPVARRQRSIIGTERQRQEAALLAVQHPPRLSTGHVSRAAVLWAEYRSNESLETFVVVRRE